MKVLVEFELYSEVFESMDDDEKFCYIEEILEDNEDYQTKITVIEFKK